jgi:radical SAM superfamily enzyme YgiQ (UPF0313 family)
MKVVRVLFATLQSREVSAMGLLYLAGALRRAGSPPCEKRGCAMQILLVGAELEENLAIRSLAASAERAGHETSLAPFASEGDTAAVVAAVQRARPDVVGLSMTFQRRGHEFGRLAEALRAAGYAGHVTAGGHFPTFAWQAVLERYPAIDTVVRHEGEATLPELCGALAAGGGPERLAAIAGLAYRDEGGTIRATRARPLECDLDGLPFPKRASDLQVHLGIPTTFLVGSRGCYGTARSAASTPS